MRLCYDTIIGSTHDRGSSLPSHKTGILGIHRKAGAFLAFSPEIRITGKK
jgi:hypothetical protein